MRFYKNVDQVGDRILVRGYDGHQEVRIRDEFYPTLYVKSNKGGTGYTTLEGEPVRPIQPGGIRDCREFCKRYEDVEGFTVYGNQAYLYQWISDNFPGEVDYDPSRSVCSRSISKPQQRMDSQTLNLLIRRSC